jgi:Zn-dependent protease
MDFLNRTFKVGRLFDVTIRIHVLFLLWMAYELITAGADWKFQLAFLVMLFSIVLLHEFGHCFGARAVGGEAHNILMWPLGGLAYAEAPMRPGPQFVTVIAGPLVNVLLCLLSAALLIGATGHVGVVSLNPFAGPGIQYMTAQWQVYVWLFYRVNLVLLCFNMLPVFPFDGGQIFRTLIWPFIGLHRATIISAQMGMVGAGLLGVFGLMRQEFLLVGIALFGGMTSFQHYQAARGGLMTEEFLGADYVLRDKRNLRSWWSRWLTRRRPESTARTIEFPRPRRDEPDEARSDRQREEAELDRILKKVSEYGINSLSYVERQKLERITRKRQQDSESLRR